MNRQYSVILGNLGNTKDRFCGGYKDNSPTLQMLERAANIPQVTRIELVGAWDIRPDNVAEMKPALDGHGLKRVSIIPDLFADKVFYNGSYSALDAKVHQHALDYSRQMCDIARELGCDLINIWSGSERLLLSPYRRLRHRAWLPG